MRALTGVIEVYNNSGERNGQLDSSIFDDRAHELPNIYSVSFTPSFIATFTEVYHVLDMPIRVISTTPSSTHPSRPRLNFAGQVVHSLSTVIGWVEMTPDDQIRWHFVSVRSYALKAR